MRVLVTGGAGFIGSHLAEYHLARGDSVQVVDDLSTGSLENVRGFLSDDRFRFDEADMLVWPELGNAAAWAERIYHMAGVVGVFKVLENPTRVLAVNIAATERLLRAARAGNRKAPIIIASTSEVYGSCSCEDRSDEFREDRELFFGYGRSLRWNYTVSKIADEAFGLSYAQEFGMPVTVVRLFNTIGPRQTGRYGMVVPRFVKQAVSGEPITVFGDGTQSRCFCDVRDTVVALDKLLSTPASAGKIFNVGNDREISIGDLAERVRTTAGSLSPIVNLSYREAYGTDFRDIRRRKPDLGRLLRTIDFSHRWSLEQTLEDLIERARAARGESALASR